MKRIGIAASKMSKGNMALYNFYVILIAFLFSVFIFVTAGSAIFCALIIMRYVSYELLGGELDRQWPRLFAVCLTALSGVIGFFMVMAVSKNIRFPRERS